MVRQQRRAAPRGGGINEEEPPLGSEKEIALSLRKFVDHSCGRVVDIALSVDGDREIYMHLNPNDTETDFQQWLNSLEEK